MQRRQGCACDVMNTKISNPSIHTSELLLSVVMAARNESKYVGQAIESIISQTYSNWELIIIDDGSIDSTPAILESYSKQDSRIRWLRHRQSQGLAASLNRGIQETRGAIIVRADADDLNMPSRFEEQLRYLGNHPEIDFVGTGAILMNEEGEEIKPFFLPSEHKDIKEIAFKNTCFFHPSVAMRKAVLERIGLYDETFLRAQDKELWLRGLNEGCLYANISKPLIRYRVTSRSSSLRVIQLTMNSLLRIGWRYKPRRWLLHCVIYLGRQLLVKIGIYEPRSLK
jgi:glycosyltransferase involved in cell wall biosynthesis